MFRHLLLAIDDSPSSEVAVDFATALAKRCSASVHVLFVNEYLVSGRGIGLLSNAETSALVTGAVEQLQGAGVHATGSACAASYSQVALRIAEAASEREADAIILGSRRRTRLGRLFSSQVRERTLRLTDLPLLTAPSPLQVSRKSKAGSFDLAAEVEEFLRVSS
jgi:nucleotide-binding universal stress UspA family protein